MIRVLCLVGLALLAAAPAWAEGGDVNGDGRVDAGDIRLIDAYLEGSLLLQDEQIKAADADGDGKITATDREMLDRRLSGLAVTPAPAGRTASAAQNQRTAAPDTTGASIDLKSADSGVVVDKTTGRPLAGVEVSLPDEGVTVRTDSQGRFQLPKSSAGKILTAKASNYAPTAMASRGGGGFQLKLERLSPRLQVVDDGLVHLGDNSFGPGSANYAEFRQPAQGRSYTKTFALDRLPQRDMILRIGSLIGLDTPESVAAGQSQLPLYGTSSDGLRVYLNGSLIKQIFINGDNIPVTIPRWLLVRGNNELRLETHPVGGNRGGAVMSSRGFGGMLGGLFGFGGGMRFPIDSTPDYDDIEFAHLVLEDPSSNERPSRVEF
ncbi:dockerin type I domain-containing protein [Gloeobacter morelensis]|uniref:Carboxypeptidase-like regulatory domain-containing protein n=1 Tax=Gloeobacter morelensis MG652769 TaxID=2781736 RepID=A0ABY3PGK6_9CYAN|nr:dockerin type I domain-containing protein [Gloeobacter morelensis]UFP92738.1 carboxypeptidase-like regulatory domain-containing protein [Gloeobacter morelensis MG652769]